MAELRCGLVACEFFPLFAFEIETRFGRSFQQAADLVEAQLIVLKKSERDPVAFFLCKWTRFLPRLCDSEIPDFLPDTKPLREWMRPGAAEAFCVVLVLCGIERAFADGRLLQWTLIEYFIVDLGAGRFRH